MKIIFVNIYTTGISFAILFAACSQEFLELKLQKSQVILQTEEDVEALLDNAGVMNRTDYFSLISDGDLYYTEEKITSISEIQRNLYLWKTDYDPTGRNTSPWDLPYQQVMYANIAMETLNAIDVTHENQEHWKELYGRALFYRAWAHYQLLQDFAEGFRPGQDQLGIPIIINSSFPKAIERSTLVNSYEFIIEELLEAEKILPQKAFVKTRPSTQAVYALLGRVYLNLHEYNLALEYVDKALDIDNVLVDFNLLQATEVPFSEFNHNTHPEIIFFSSSNVPFVASVGIQVVDELYEKYTHDDLRKSTFFNDDMLYVGTYSGRTDYHFTGLATDELYIMKAECLARLDRMDDANVVLLLLLTHRYKNNLMDDNLAEAKTETLRWILEERQKELIGRGTRWTDLKRLNRESELKSELRRIYEGESYILPANSNRYVFAIPPDEIDISGIEQNNRND